MAVRIDLLRGSSLVATRVGSVQRTLVASPDYLALNGKPLTPAMLVNQHLIAGAAPSAQREWRFGCGVLQERVRITPRLTINEVEAQFDRPPGG